MAAGSRCQKISKRKKEQAGPRGGKVQLLLPSFLSRSQKYVVAKGLAEGRCEGQVQDGDSRLKKDKKSQKRRPKRRAQGKKSKKNNQSNKKNNRHTKIPSSQATRDVGKHLLKNLVPFFRAFRHSRGQKIVSHPFSPYFLSTRCFLEGVT